MVNTQLLDYVKQQLAQGVDKETIHHNLLSAGGWNPSDIDEAFSVMGIGVASNVPRTSSGIPTAPVKYAGFWVRWVAIAVDGLVLIIPVGIAQFAVGLVLAGVGLPAVGVKIVSSLVYTLITWLYFSLMTYNKGATLGKMLVGVTVKSDDFQKLSLGRVLLRETVGKFVSGIILGIGYIIAGVTQRKQALHDKFAHSVVVYNGPSKPHHAGLIVGIIIAVILPALAILGILSSVVLVSLNTARQKGQDAQVKSVLSQMRTEAEVYYGQNNNSYSTASNCSSGMFADPSFATIKSSLKSDATPTCYAEGTTYAISAPLSTSGQNYCVDSSAYSGNGTAIDDGSKALCQVDDTVSSNLPTSSGQNQAVQQTSNTVTNTSYSYTLPSGWQSVPNSGQGVQASNKVAGYVLSIATVPLPASAGNITSVTQIMDQSSMSQIIQSEFPNAIISNVGSDSFGGEKTIITTFSGTVTATVSGSQKQSKPLTMVQYDVVHKGILYTIVFMSASSDKDTARSDFQSIINSFMFKS